MLKRSGEWGHSAQSVSLLAVPVFCSFFLLLFFSFLLSLSLSLRRTHTRGRVCSRDAEKTRYPSFFYIFLGAGDRTQQAGGLQVWEERRGGRTGAGRVAQVRRVEYDTQTSPPLCAGGGLAARNGCVVKVRITNVSRPLCPVPSLSVSHLLFPSLILWLLLSLPPESPVFSRPSASLFPSLALFFLFPHPKPTLHLGARPWCCESLPRTLPCLLFCKDFTPHPHTPNTRTHPHTHAPIPPSPSSSPPFSAATHAREREVGWMLRPHFFYFDSSQTFQQQQKKGEEGQECNTAAVTFTLCIQDFG